MGALIVTVQPKQTSKKKADCTEEEWEAHLAYHRQRWAEKNEELRAKKREYAALPHVKAARAAQDARPEAKASRSAREKAKRAEIYARVKENPEAWSRRIEAQQKRRTGFSRDEIKRLAVIQDDRCAICDVPFEGRQMRADHCHDTGQPRGLLCHHCNIIEGMLRAKGIKPEDFAKRMERYLAHPPYLLLIGPKRP